MMLRQYDHIFILRVITYTMNQADDKKTILIIDTSYTIFYRFFATKRWYGFAHKEDYKACENFFLDEVFKAKYKKLFIQMFTTLCKKYNSDFSHIVFAIDTSRSTIWRNEHIEQYKGNRTRKKGDEAIGDFFKYTYQVIIPELIQHKKVTTIQYPTLEADDCIYIAKQIIRDKNPTQPIVIIGSDHDLMQLLDNSSPELTKIITLQGKSLQDKSCGDSQKDLHIKIITGDKSDNIPSCFSKCGYKTALKLADNKDLLEKKFTQQEGSREIYERNKKIISFKHIPTHLVEACYTQYKDILYT